MNTAPHLVAFDLDGTLSESKQAVGPDMGALIAELLERMPVAIMSGGAFHQFETQLLPALPENAKRERLYLFPVSAALCYTCKDGSWLRMYDNSFTPQERVAVLCAFDEALKETGFDVPPEKVWGERLEDRGAQFTFSALGQQAPVEEKKTWDPTREKRAPLAEALRRRLPDFTVAVNATTSIDVTRKGLTKAYGVRRLSEITGIAIKDMLYVGDALQPGGNDYVVVETGIPTTPVKDPIDTAKIIRSILTS